MRGTGGGKNTKEEAKAKARARTKAEEKERKVRNDSMKWRTQAVNKKGTSSNGTKTRTHGMKTVAQERDRVA